MILDIKVKKKHTKSREIDERQHVEKKWSRRMKEVKRERQEHQILEEAWEDEIKAFMTDFKMRNKWEIETLEISLEEKKIMTYEILTPKHSNAQTPQIFIPYKYENM